MTTDFRALCAELVQIADALDGKSPSVANQGQSLDGFAALANFRQVAARARAALADEPAVPEGREPASVTGQPSDEAWDALVERAWDKYQTVGYQGERFMYDRDFGNALEFVRQGLTRWGNPAPQPVPVSERLPGQEDCDEKGYCWRWNTISGVWSRQHYSRHWYEFETHWLPAHALPVPGQEVEG